MEKGKSKLNLVQSLRRMGQKMTGWKESFKMQDAQYNIIKKLYAKHGLEIKMTCSACPEQYDIFKDGQQVAYYRLRHGEFRVDVPDCGDETIYEDFPNGDGCFDEDERIKYLNKAMKAILKKLNS